MSRWKVSVKEVGNPMVLHPMAVGDYDLSDIRSLFGLEEDDVEWFTIERQKE